MAFRVATKLVSCARHHSSSSSAKQWKEAFELLLESADAPSPREARARGDAKRALVSAAQAQPVEALQRIDRGALRLVACAVCESHGDRKAVNSALRLRAFIKGQEKDRDVCICRNCAMSERFPPPGRIAQGDASLSDASRVLLYLAIDEDLILSEEELDACSLVANAIAELQR